MLLAELIDLDLLLPFSILNIIFSILFLDSTGRTDEELIEHYISYHKINPENYFFLGLFKGENGLFCKECIRCNEFLTTKAEVKKHNFLKHYLAGEQEPAVFKPIDLIRNKDITIY